jgi:hypothetical protein
MHALWASLPRCAGAFSTRNRPVRKRLTNSRQFGEAGPQSAVFPRSTGRKQCVPTGARLGAMSPRMSAFWIDGSRPAARMSADKCHGRTKRMRPVAALGPCTRSWRQRLVSPDLQRPQIPCSASSWILPSLDLLTPDLIFLSDEAWGIDPNQSNSGCRPCPQPGRTFPGADLPRKPLKKPELQRSAVVRTTTALAKREWCGRPGDHFAAATRTGSGPERRRMLAFADTLIDLAETKKLLLHYEAG